MSHRFPSLPNIESLIDGDGDITIGRVGPIRCAATACDEDQSLATLSNQWGPLLLMMRLDTAIDNAVEEEIFIDEINNGPDSRI